MQPVIVKDAAHQLIDQLPDDANWDDVVYEIMVRREIEKGLNDSDNGQTVPINDVLKEFSITE